MIELSNIQYRWPGQAEPTIQIDRWHLSRGESVFLYGPSGSGKSTLLNLLSGIIKPQQGSLKVLDNELTAMGGRARDAFRARHIGVIFQQFNLLPYLTVEDNIQLAMHFSKGSGQSAYSIDQFMQQLSLDAGLLRQKAGALSVGQQQRVAMIRALINQPRLIIADEPTSALDSDSRDDFIDLLLDCSKNSQSSVVFVSHDRSLASHFDHQLDIHDINKAGSAS